MLAEQPSLSPRRRDGNSCGIGANDPPARGGVIRIADAGGVRATDTDCRYIGKYLQAAAARWKGRKNSSRNRKVVRGSDDVRQEMWGLAIIAALTRRVTARALFLTPSLYFSSGFIAGLKNGIDNCIF